MCLRVNRKVHMACDLNFIDESEKKLMVTGSHVGLHSRRGSISEMVQDRDVITTGPEQEMLYTA